MHNMSMVSCEWKLAVAQKSLKYLNLAIVQPVWAFASPLTTDHSPLTTHHSHDASAYYMKITNCLIDYLGYPGFCSNFVLFVNCSWGMGYNARYFSVTVVLNAHVPVK